MKGLKRIALSGRAVCATIHQPSIAIFNSFDSLLLLKRGGETVFFGDLGEYSQSLIEYLQRYDATPKIQPGENPATWMLTTIGAGSAAVQGKPFDYAGSYTVSKLHVQCVERINQITAAAVEEGLVSFPKKYATSKGTQSSTVFYRAMTVYFRCPSYNLVRMLVSAVVALLFGSVYASQRVPENESDMNSRINSIFIAVVFLAVNALNTVLAVFESERNMFYRHKAALMYDSSVIARALTLAEIPFIFMAATIFMVLFYFIMGVSHVFVSFVLVSVPYCGADSLSLFQFANDAKKFFLFFMFFTFNLATYTFTGQMATSLLRDAATAQVVGGLVISMTVLFSGILLRPDQIPSFWIFAYWMFPGHYVFEGIIMSQYENDDTPILASPGTAFYTSLKCASDQICEGTAEEWVASSFPDWNVDNVPWNALYLIGVIIVTRVVTFWALTSLNYRST